MNAYDLLPNRDLLDGAGLPGVTRATPLSSFHANQTHAARRRAGVSCLAQARGPLPWLRDARKCVKNLRYWRPGDQPERRCA